MLKVFAAVLCFYLACNLLVNGAAIENDSSSSSSAEELIVANGTAVEGTRQKRSAYDYWPWYHHGHHDGHHGHHDYYDYYHWYNLHPTEFIVGTCPPQYACPAQCPGTCGTWGGLYACRCHGGCPLIGDPCNHYNIHRGHYLHPFPHDASRYIQCDTTPGIVYIRNCPAHLVFDPRFSVCNYPSNVFHHHHHHGHHYGHHDSHAHGHYHYGK
jgi:hypothetical protein